MPSKSKSRGSRGSFVVHEDSLADVEPLTLAEFEDVGDEAVKIVLSGAARLDRSIPYRERLMRAIRFYLRSDNIPYVVMSLNKRILAARDRKQKEAAEMVGMAPRCEPGIAAGKGPMHGMEASRD